MLFYKKQRYPSDSAEDDYLAMLEVRRWKESKLADFNRRLAEAQKELHPPSQAG